MDAVALRALRRAAAALALASLAAPARAHDPSALPGWTTEPWLLAAMAGSAATYALGVRALWRKAGTGRGISRRQAGAFAVGWTALAAALVSPLDGLGARLFSAHMVQHELMMIVAAPLMVLGRPLAAWAWAWPAAGRAVAARVGRGRWLGATWRWLTDPLVAWALHAVVLWAWHAPALFQAALEREAVHVLQHATFLGSALLFWWPMLRDGARGAARGPAMLYLFTTMVHTGALGALLALSPVAWYPAYAATSLALGMDPLEDQQLGGLVMWVPASLSYLVAGLAVAARWLSGERATSSVAPAAAPSVGARRTSREAR